MKRHLNFILTLTLLMVLVLISACDINRPSGSPGDLPTAIPQPAAGGITPVPPPATTPIRTVPTCSLPSRDMIFAPAGALPAGPT